MQRDEINIIGNVTRLKYFEGIYGVNLEVIYGGTREQYHEYLRSIYPRFDFEKRELNSSAAGTLTVVVRDPDDRPIEWFMWLAAWRRHKATKENLITLHHECMHFTFSVLRSRGIVLIRETEEAYTYYTDAICRILMRDIEAANHERAAKTRRKKNKR